MNARLPHATIFADASMCGRTGAAGWGAWMISRARPSLLEGGALRGEFDSIIEAELAALVNGLHVAGRAGYLADGALIMLQSDSTAALGLIRAQFNAPDSPPQDKAHGIPVTVSRLRCWGKPKGDNREPPGWALRRRLLLAMKGQVDARQLRLVVRHVKGHRNKAASEGDGRAWVNVKVDRLARAGMIEARLKLTGGIDA